MTLSMQVNISDGKIRAKCKQTILTESIEVIYKVLTFLLIKWPNKTSDSPNNSRPSLVCFKILSYLIHGVLILSSGRFWLLLLDKKVQKEKNLIFALVIIFYTTFVTFSLISRFFCKDGIVQLRDRLLELGSPIEDEKKLISMTQRLNYWIIFQLTFGCLCTIAIWSLMILIPGENSVLLIFFSYPITVESDAYIFVSVLCIILLVAANMWAQMTAVISMWLMLFLRNEFDSLAEAFRRDFSRDSAKQKNGLSENERNSRIFEIYDNHDRLCGVLEPVNFLCRTYLSFIFSVPIAQACLLIYELIHHPMEIIEFIYLLSMMVYNATAAFIYLKESIKLKSSAHQLTDDLYAIDLRNMSPEASLKVSIFLTRLTSSPIGISVAGLFVIDHSTILMLTGTLLTYIIVVIQTKAPECNCYNGINITAAGI